MMSSRHLWTEERAIHGTSMYMIRLIVLGIKVFGLSRKKSEIFSISLIANFVKPNVRFIKKKPAVYYCCVYHKFL